MLKLQQLNDGDEFFIGGSDERYKLLPTDDADFMIAGTLVVENQRTGARAKLAGETDVQLINVLG